MSGASKQASGQASSPECYASIFWYVWPKCSLPPTQSGPALKHKDRSLIHLSHSLNTIQLTCSVALTCLLIHPCPEIQGTILVTPNTRSSPHSCLFWQCMCVCVCVCLCVCACVFVSFLLTLVMSAPMSRKFRRRFCVCMCVCVVVYLCLYCCRSSSWHG